MSKRNKDKMFGNKEFIVASHSVNVYSKSDLELEVRCEETAIDVQI